MKEITAEELKQKIDNGESFIFLDVRELFETYISSIDIETVSIPLDELGNRADELGKDDEIIVMCRCGNRSKTACELLIQYGFVNVANLKGGINSWAARIDTSLPQY
jgi:rhodanese-related sulfurtransferase